MDSSRPQGSIFSQQIDRVAFTSYFLGAVIPLVALGVVVDRYALPSLSERIAEYGLLALVGSIALLSLASFLVLRHVTRRTLARMDHDNAQLEALLAGARSLAGSQHVTEATATTVRCAMELTGAPAAYVFLRGEGDDHPALAETAGDGAAELYPRIERSLEEAAALVIDEGGPVICGPDAEGSAPHVAVVVPLPGEKSHVGALAVARPGNAAPFSPAQVDALTTLAALCAVSLHNSDLRDAQRNFFAHVTDLLVTALDSHLGYNSGHGQRVAQLANRLGRAVGLADARMQRLHFAALLHDIGMLRLPRSAQMDRRKADKHCMLGFRMLVRIRLWKDVAPLVLHHHEWYDGSGYPEGLTGEEVPVEARIIALCDAFDTMTADTSYKTPRSIDDAVVELRSCSGTQFDPELVETFVGLVEEGLIEAA